MNQAAKWQLLKQHMIQDSFRKFLTLCVLFLSWIQRDKLCLTLGDAQGARWEEGEANRHMVLSFPFALPSLPCMLFPCWAAGYGLFSSAGNTKTVCIQVTKSSVSFATEYDTAPLHHKHRDGKKIRKKFIDKSILSSFLVIHPGYVCY